MSNYVLCKWETELQSFGHLMPTDYSLENTLMLGKTEGRRRRGWQRMRWLDGITDAMDTNLAKSGRWGRTGKEAWRAAVRGVTKAGHKLPTKQPPPASTLWSSLVSRSAPGRLVLTTPCPVRLPLFPARDPFPSAWEGSELHAVPCLTSITPRVQHSMSLSDCWPNPRVPVGFESRGT